jgi:hypothetical protein
MDRKCETCLYWLSSPFRPTYGYCRRYPAIAINADSAYHVETPVDDWCGEWKEKEQEE